jgi:DNA processing protein
MTANGTTASAVTSSGMTASAGRSACPVCLRRSWLLAALSHRLEEHAGDRARLLELLALEDRELIEAIAGDRRGQLRARYARFHPSKNPVARGVESICRHDRDYPRALADDGAPWMLCVSDMQRFRALSAAPIVAIVGSRKATDYGIEMARSLARGLAASGVSVASSLADGIAVAAQAGALEVNGKTLVVREGGLDMPCTVRRRELYKRVQKDGCTVAELPCDFGARANSWCHTARDRIVVGMAELTIVVEADGGPIDLLGARIAKALGRGVAAVPGRVTSPVSRGTHALLREGATLIGRPADALELLGSQGPPPAPELEPRLRTTLEQVGAGRDTPAKLTAGCADAGEVLLALSELEVMGLLTRGDGGRYVPRESLACVRPLAGVKPLAGVAPL